MSRLDVCGLASWIEPIDIENQYLIAGDAIKPVHDPALKSYLSVFVVMNMTRINLKRNLASANP